MHTIEQGDSFKKRLRLLARVETAAKAAGLADVYNAWRSLERDSDGDGKAQVNGLAGKSVSQGENIFWKESTRQPGLLFLFSPPRALTMLANAGGGNA